MHSAYYGEMARQWVAEQGEEASAHLADAIKALRAVGDAKGARLLLRIAKQVALIDEDTPHTSYGRAIRRPRNGSIDPSA